MITELKSIRLVKFCIVGGTGIFVNNGILYFSKEILKLPLEIAGFLAIFLSLVYVFYLNDIWTFKDKRKGKIYERFIKFCLSRSLGFITNYLVLLFLTYLGIFYIISNIVGIFAGFLVNYYTSKKFVWK